MTYEVSAAAKPPQTTPLFIGIRVDTLGGMASIAAGAPRGESHIQTVSMGQISQETGKRPNGAAAAILAVPPPRIDVNEMAGCLRRFCRRRYFVRHCSRVIRADSPLKTAFCILLATQVIGVKRAEY